MASWYERLVGPRWNGTTGRPRSANGASSFHLFWLAPPGPWTRAAVTLEVIDPPSTPDLAFWALQVTFSQAGRRGGGAHLGLQWHDGHPDSTAVNWGGYRPEGGELAGSTSTLRSATGNTNTRDYPWRAGSGYRLIVERAVDQAAPPAGEVAWQGSLTDLATGRRTAVRDLYATGTHLEGVMVWSEVFADCSAPTSAVRWSDMVLTDEAGRSVDVESVEVNYQRLADGGCVTTDSDVDASGVVQRTGVRRRTDQGALLAVPGQSRS